MIDAATGRFKDKIIPPVERAGGTFWKWMAMEDGVLYALMGEQEQRSSNILPDAKDQGPEKDQDQAGKQ